MLPAIYSGWDKKIRNFWGVIFGILISGVM